MRFLSALKDELYQFIGKRGSFRERILFSTVVIIVVITFSVLFLVNYLVTVEVKKNISERLLSTREVFEEFKRAQSQRLLSECKVIAAHPSLKEVLISNNPLLFASEAERYQRLINAEIFVVLSSFGSMVKVVDQPYRYARELFTPEMMVRAASGEEFVITVNRLDKIFQLAFVPIRKGDELLGSLSIGYEIDEEFVKAVKRVTESEVTLVVQGKIVASTLKGKKLSALSSFLSQLKKEGGGKGSSKFEANLDGERFLSLVMPVSNDVSPKVAYCLIQQSLDVPLRFLWKIRMGLLGVSLFALVIAFLATFFISQALATPLNQLVSGARRIADGELDYEIPIPKYQEMGVLARAFNEMRLSLKRHLSQLNELNRRLAERVKEISTIHRITRLITASLEERRVFRTIVSEARKFTRVDAALLAFSGKDRNEITVASLSPRGWVRLTKSRRVPFSEMIVGEVMAKGKIFFLNHPSPDAPFIDERALAQLGIESAVILPISLKVEQEAVFLVARKEGRYSSAELRMLEQIASQLSLTLNNIFLYQRLRESEEKYRRLFQSVKDAVYRADKEGRCVMINQAGAELFGFSSPEEMIGVKFSEFYVDRRELEAFLDELRKRGYVTGFRSRLRRRDGEEVFAEASGVLIRDRKGRVIATEGMIRDVTKRVRLERELAESEAFLRRVIENTSDAIFTLDLEGRFSFINSRFLEITGLKKEEVFDAPFTLLFPEEHWERAKKILRACIEKREPVIHEEVEAINAKGERLTLLLSLAPLTSEEGVYGVVGTASDITVRKQLEEKLIQSERLASMGEVAAGVAHEINNPLGIVLGFTQDLLSETSENHPHYRYLKIIEQETSRCAKVVRDLLHLTHSRSLNLRKVRISEVLEHSLSLLRLKLRDSNIRLTKEIPDDLPVLEIDPEQMKQVFVNLILNAIQAMPGGGNLRIKVGVNGDGKGNSWIRVEVIDTGCGIKKKDIDKVFEPFYTTKKSGGTGLGLSVSRQIIEAHRGKIELVSEEGKGTTCIITLPLSPGGNREEEGGV
ncbi:MAG: PAS domain S-box protein [Acidobacteria bacterium]|nr:PAS domain S-box protein [Acidobacteriota bacterium]